MFGTHEERAARGAKWLDRVRPGWYKQVDPETLDDSPTRCVIGQTFGDYNEVVNEKFYLPAGWHRSRKMLFHPGMYLGIFWALRHEFEIWHSYEEEAWRAAWRKQIEARKNPIVADTFPAEWGERTPPQYSVK